MRYWNNIHQVRSKLYDSTFSVFRRFVLSYIKNNTVIILSAGGLLVPKGIVRPVVKCFGTDIIY
jgi:hypothetical protein